METQAELQLHANSSALKQIATSQHDEQHNQCVIISTNGMRIASKLNPAAKEFYPAYMRAERLQQCAPAAPVEAEAQPKCEACEACLLAGIDIMGADAIPMAAIEVAPALNVTFDITHKSDAEPEQEPEPEVIEAVADEAVVTVPKPLDCAVVNVCENIEAAAGDVIKSNIDDCSQCDDIKIEAVAVVEDNSKDNSKDDATKVKMKLAEKAPAHKAIHAKISPAQEKLKEAKTEPPKKKDEKQSAFRKLGKIMLGSGTKTAAAEKPKPAGTKATISCTKRISESLHNLTSSLKSKTDLKATDSASGVLPRASSAANTRSPQPRSRTAGVKAAGELNGTLSATTAAAKLNLATEKSGATKSSTAFGQSKPLHRKLHSVSPSKSAERSSTPMGSSSKSKESVVGSATAAATAAAVPKLPRSTLSSSLRQSEAQRRRHLFPSDDPESKANIELPQFLFK